MFGNSLSSDLPTWAVYADNLTDTATAGVITDDTLLQTVDDFKYSTATDNRWHQHVLTYNGKNAPLPTLQYFVDATEMVGNSRLENGTPHFFRRLVYAGSGTRTLCYRVSASLRLNKFVA